MKARQSFFAIALSVISMLLCCNVANAEKKSGIDKKKSYRYDVEYVKSVGTGMNQVRVWSYTKNKKEDVELSKRNAVHAVIFKGYSGNGATKPALAKDPNTEATFVDFFNEFFTYGGEYGRFVTGCDEREVRKYGKEFKIGETVNVSTDALRKYLESKGVIKGLSYGF